LEKETNLKNLPKQNFIHHKSGTDWMDPCPSVCLFIYLGTRL